MVNMARANMRGESVQTTDELTKAIEAAHERAQEVYSGGRSTLVDQIPSDVWASWDASNECALVADSCGLDAYDPLDAELDLDRAA